MSEYIIPDDTPVKHLSCENAFSLLSEKEKLYAHYMCKASWIGNLICVVQVSPESPLLWSLFYKLFRLQSVEDFTKHVLQHAIASEEELHAFLLYASGILFHTGNYLRFGSKKFIPNLSKEKCKDLFLSSKFAKQCPEHLSSLLSKCLDKMYSLQSKEQKLDFPDKGTTSYLSKNITRQDNEIVNAFFEEKKFEPLNTRLFKIVEEAGQVCYEVRIASILSTADKEDSSFLHTAITKDWKIQVTRGDYSAILSLVNKNLQLAIEYAANENQVNMLKKLVKGFLTGSTEEHKDSVRFWLKDKDPIVESVVGFTETYHDPAGVRGEFEGIIALVNKETSVKYGELVKSSEEFINLLPWPKEYEVDEFLIPDCTSINIMAYSRDPALACCLPNYKEIRESEGYKNLFILMFNNVLLSRYCDSKPEFIDEMDACLTQKYISRALETHVGLHELLGHGSGKLLMENSDGSFNFDKNSVLDFETNEKVASWYKPGETHRIIFGDFSNSFEECRAETVALYLCTVPEISRIFVIETSEADDAMYVNWLRMALSGLEGLENYDPVLDKWTQAHDWARFVILRVLLQVKDFVKIEKRTGKDGKPDLLLTMDRSKILTTAKDAVGKFLKKITLYRSTANVSKALALYDRYSVKSKDSEYPFLEFREIIVARKKPRNLFVGVNTFVEDGKVSLKKYEASPEGLITSHIERFQDTDVESLLEDIWEKDKHHFS